VKTGNIISSLFWLALGGGVCYGGYDLDIGTLHNPGSGFMFFWMGVFIIGLSLCILVPAVKSEGVKGELRAVWAGIRWQKVISVLAALFVYAYVLTPLGFVPATILLLTFLFKAVEPQKWSWAIFGAVVSTLAAYGLFQLWLGCQLPQGLLGV
jgi:putative tricarboxylic transport membrane protein